MDLGEKDRILTILSREAGKLGAVAKGSRGGTSKLSGATEPFTYSRMLLASGRSLDIISQCEIRESFPALRNDLQMLARAQYFCELTDRFMLDREPNAEVFDLLLSALYLLKRMRDQPDVITHAFELHLLAERGYTPELDICVRCGERVLDLKAGFSPALGGALCISHNTSAQDAFTVRPAALELMRTLLRAEPEELVMIKPDSSAMLDIDRCLRWYIRYRTEYDIKSALFLDMVRRM